MDKAPIVEIFETIQGEGKNIGTPSIFIRLWGCNLRCTFKGECCDTPYAVFKERDKAKMTTVLDLVNVVRQYKNKHIVWTGGEPMLFQKFIQNTMHILSDFTCEVETNGTIPLDDETIKKVNLFNISVKLKSSNQGNGYDDKRINDDALKTYPQYKSYFKFVYNSENDIDEIVKLKHKYGLDVYLMPQGITREEIVKNSINVVNECLKYKFKFSPREHIIIWDNKRGV